MDRQTRTNAPATHATVAGRAVRRLAFGTMRLAGREVGHVRACLDAALEAGLALIDTAPIYGAGGPGFGDAEARLGAAWADAPSLRDDAVLVTKAGIVPGQPYDSAPATLAASCEASLRRLGTDRIDLFLVHRPDHLAGHAAVGAALDALVDAGKVRAVGVSNHTPAQVRALAAHMRAPLAANQVELSPLAPEAISDGTLDQCEELGLVPMTWSPLGGGRLMGDAPAPPREAAVRAALDAIAARAGVGRDAAALAWALAHPAGAVPVLGTSDPARIAPAARALDVAVTRPEWYAVLEAARGAPMP